MAKDPEAVVPKSPEEQEPYVREELDQELITHKGEARTDGDASQAEQEPETNSQYMGATEEDVMPNTPPMAGPADLVGEKNIDAQGNETGSTEVGEETYDPRDELTPG